MVSVAKRFKVSGSYLARICTRLNVPRPARGYWAKLAVGKAPLRRELPEPLPGDEISWNPDGSAPEINRAPSSKPKKVGAPPKAHPKPDSDSTSEHDLLRQARSLFLIGRLTYQGKYLKPSKRLLPDLQVTKSALNSALEFANTLFLALERRGHRVTFSPVGEFISRPEMDTRDKPDKRPFRNDFWSPARNTVLYVNGIPIGLTVLELTESTTMRYVNGEYVREEDYVPPKSLRAHVDHWVSIQDIPCRRLSLQAYASCYDAKWSRQWKEDRPGDFLRKIASLVRDLELCADEAAKTIQIGKEHAKTESLRHEAMRKKWQEDQEESRRVKALADSRIELDAMIEMSVQHSRLEQFIAKIEAEAGNLDKQNRERLEALITEARKLLGVHSALANFMNWRPPGERV